MRISTGWVKSPGIIVVGCALVVASVCGLVYLPADQSSSLTSFNSTPQSSLAAASRPAPRVPSTVRDSGREPGLAFEEEEEGERERFDQPGEAAEFHRLKRLPEGETEVPVERYLIAQEKMRDLPVYSTIHNRLFPSRRALLNSALAMEPALLDGWKSLGPGNLGGRTRAMLLHPTNPDVMYVAAASGGVWKTTDGGKNWRPLTDLLPNLAVNALALDPANPDVIYAGTGEGYFNSDAVRGAGIFRSFDGGATWRRLDGTGTADFHYVNDIVVSPTRSNRIYAATRTGVMRSLDGGATWTRVHEADRVHGGCFDLAIRADQPKDYVFAACGTAIGANSPASVQSTIYRNTDAAASFVGWDAVYTEPGMGRTSLAIAPSNQNVVYAVSAENGATGAAHSLHAVFRSNKAARKNNLSNYSLGLIL